MTTTAKLKMTDDVAVTARDLAIQVRREMPHASRLKQQLRYDELLNQNSDARFEVHAHSLDNLDRDLEATQLKAERDAKRVKQITKAQARHRDRSPDDIRAKKKISEERVVEHVEVFKSRLVLLSLTMPNGKPMRACTGVEMGGFGRAYAKIADKVGEREVGDVLSEEQVERLIEKGKQ